ncbi:MAG: hypothetical protein ISR65_03770 [Bacteriovoracaceae bacterium]|nr:hypothetical protein [Bacteriovoracaceae bacterium]
MRIILLMLFALIVVGLYGCRSEDDTGIISAACSFTVSGNLTANNQGDAATVTSSGKTLICDVDAKDISLGYPRVSITVSSYNGPATYNVDPNDFTYEESSDGTIYRSGESSRCSITYETSDSGNFNCSILQVDGGGSIIHIENGSFNI